MFMFLHFLRVAMHFKLHVRRTYKPFDIVTLRKLILESNQFIEQLGIQEKGVNRWNMQVQNTETYNIEMKQLSHDVF